MLQKVLGKAEVTGEIGEKIDSLLEQAEREAHQKEGAKAAFGVAASAVQRLHEHVDKDLEDEKLPEKFETQEEAASYIKKWITRGVEICLNLKEKTQAEVLVANGKVVGLRGSVELVQRFHSSAVSRGEQILAAMEEASEGSPDATSEQEAKGRRRNRGPGEHPGPSPLDERRKSGRQEKVQETKPESTKPLPKPKSSKVRQKIRKGQ